MALPRGEHHLSEIKRLAGNLGESGAIDIQSLSGAPPKPNFEALEHSVYSGRQRLGRYCRIAPHLYAAFDSEDRPLGNFQAACAAYAAVVGAGGFQ